MTIQVWVLSHPRVFDPTGAGAILHLWVRPNLTRTDLGLGVGFILHPWVHPPLEF
jgi:hypothetical protein